MTSVYPMMRCSYVGFVLLQHVLNVQFGVQAHGRLWEPPSRSSMWRLGYNTSINTDDNELSCGGFTNQWVHFGGRCGLCGDPYQQQPRENEYGGKYASGWITRTYPINGKIDVIVDLTANHGGYFEFRLCPTDEVTGADPPICSDQNRLPIVNSGPDSYRYHIEESSIDGHINLQVILPQNVICKHCLFQWKYHTGTRWGCDDKLQCKKGLGPQEEFYGCSDISIENVPATVFRDPLDFVKHSNNVQFATPKMFVSSDYGYNTNYGKGKNKYGYTEKTRFTNGLFTKYLQQIVVKALMKYYDNSAKFDDVAIQNCSASSAFSNNPIVNEWCHQTCPTNRGACKPTLCTCEAKRRNVPTKNVPNTTIVRGGDHNQVHKDLGMTKKQFESFVLKVLRAYGKTHTQRVISPSETNSSLQLAENNAGLTFTRTKIIKPDTSKVLFIKVMAENSKQASSKYNNVSPNQFKEAFKNVIPTKTEIESKLKGIDKLTSLSQDVFNQKTKPVQTLVKPTIIICESSIEFSHNKYMNKWCKRNCSFGFCPKSVCSCN